ncbi:MFS transporter [Caulobacter vibrioides]|nr:MFS transporter [Caulobacter vibrioides]
MRIEFAFAAQVFTATLNDSPPARELLSMLPLDLKISDFSSNEKIAFLPRKLTARGAPAYADPKPGDLCYYAPWGNLALFYEGYSASPDLIRLGRLDDGVAPLRRKGDFPLRIERRS